MLRWFAACAAAFALAAPAMAQEIKAPKIVPASFTDPGKVAYKFTKGETETYVTTLATDMITNVTVMGQNMDIAGKGTSRTRLSLKVLDDAVPTKVEASIDHMKSKQSMDLGMTTMEITIDDKKIKALQGDQVIVDSEKGITNPMVDQVAKAAEYIGKKAVVVVDASGRNGPKAEGDPEMVKFAQNMTGQSLYGLIWNGQESLKVGDTWDVEYEVRAFEQVELTKPIKVKATYKVVGAVTVDGVPCIDIEMSAPLKAANLEMSMKQGGMDIAMKISSFAIEMAGHMYYDPKVGRPIYSDAKGTVSLEATGEIPQVGGEMTMKTSVKLKTTSQRNAAW